MRLWLLRALPSTPGRGGGLRQPWQGCEAVFSFLRAAFEMTGTVIVFLVPKKQTPPGVGGVCFLIDGLALVGCQRATFETAGAVIAFCPISVAHVFNAYNRAGTW